MINRKFPVHILQVFFVFTILFFTGTVIIFQKSYKDPRWRYVDFNSRQVTESDIYNVSEIPTVKSVRFSGERKLRFEFTPRIKTRSWTVRAKSDNRIISQGPFSEIQFGDKPSSETYIFIPKDVKLYKEIEIAISTNVKEQYEKAGYSWPDYYHKTYSSVQFSKTNPYSIEEWAGLPGNDPDVIEARRIMGGSINMNAPSLDRSEQVFTFIMNKIKNCRGIPTDEVNNASPLETYRFLSKSSGCWCENKSLVYYLFANAAGVKTRLVDICGQVGPLFSGKASPLFLTMYYFCESWDPDQNCWYYVDPQMNTANVRNSKGKLLNTLEIKRLFELDEIDICTVREYDRETGSLVTTGVENFMRLKTWIKGDNILAYKFGYPKNKTYSKLKHFICYITLLYAPFSLPKLYLVKNTFLAGFIVSLILSILTGACLIILKDKKRC